MAYKKLAPAEAEATRPGHAGELCGCGATVVLDPSATSFGCEHGSWSFPAADAPAAEPVMSDDDKRAAALAILGLTEEQMAAAQATQ